MASEFRVLLNDQQESTWTEQNTAHLDATVLSTMADLLQWNINSVSEKGREALMQHYGVGTIQEVVPMITSADRGKLVVLAARKLKGNTGQVQTYDEAIWSTTSGTIDHTATGATVTVDNDVVELVEKIIPLPVVTRPGLGNLVNVASCVAHVEAGKLVPMKRHDLLKRAFATTLANEPQITDWVLLLGRYWDEDPNLRPDREAFKTCHGFECASIFVRFFTGMSIDKYLIVQTKLCNSVLRIFQFKKLQPTDNMLTEQVGKVTKPVVPVTSVSAVTPQLPGEWGKSAKGMAKNVGILPKILVGPIPMTLNWIPLDTPITPTTVAAAVTNATAVRGGDKSYWSKMANCNGFAVSSEAVNRKRLLVALAAGVMAKGASVQIETSMADLGMIDVSLQKLGFSKTLFKFLITKEEYVKASKHAEKGRMAWLAIKGSVYVGINNTKAPSVGGKEKVEVEYEKSSLSYLSTISRDYIGFIIWTQVLHPIMFDGQVVVEIREIHDLRVLLTTDPDFVSNTYFPKKKLIKTYEDFGRRVLEGTGRSIAQIFHPMKNRTESLKLLNILHMARDTLAMRVNGATMEWEAAPIDTNTFDDSDDSDDTDSEGDDDGDSEQEEGEEESEDSFEDAEEEAEPAKVEAVPPEKVATKEVPPKKIKPAPEKKKKKKSDPDGKEPKERRRAQKGEVNFTASLLEVTDGVYTV